MRRNILISAVFIGAAALVFAADVKTDYSHSVDFGQYHTYSWLKVDAGNPLWVDRIRRDVDAELTAKGWSKVDSGGDAAVSGFGATHNQQTLETFYDGFGGGWFWRGFGGPDLGHHDDGEYARRHAGDRHFRRSYQKTDLAWHIR